MLQTNRLTWQYLAISGCLLSTATGTSIITFHFYHSGNVLEQSVLTIVSHGIAAPLFVVPCLFLGSICFYLAWVPVSRGHSLATSIGHFLLLLLFAVLGIRFRFLFDKATRNPRRKQHEVLMEILSSNANTEYGKLHGFANIKDPEDFKAKHSLTTYDTYRPFCERMSDNGEQNLLTSDEVSRFAVSSGTTGKCKVVPITGRYLIHVMLNLYVPFIYTITKFKNAPYFSPLKVSQFTYVPPPNFTKCNKPLGPATGLLSKKSMFVVSIPRIFPTEAEQYIPEQAQCYLHLLFSLYDRDLVRIDSSFGAATLSMLEFLQKHWPQLVEDIKFGQISRTFPDIPLDLIERTENAGRLWPDQKRAAELRLQFSQGFEGILSRIWPRLNLILCATTGTHAIYHDRIKWYCGPNVKLYSGIYGASEGVFGLNTDPSNEDDQVFTLLPHLTFMEFIPEEEVTSQNPQTLLMEQLEIGRRYEVVMTSMLGFYRYRMGDVVKVVRFRNEKTPVVRFCGRVGGILDVASEKTSEEMLCTALTRAASQWEGCQELMEYTTTESISLSKATRENEGFGEIVGVYYVIFVEARGLNRCLSPEEVMTFDDILGEVQVRYKAHRKKTIGEPKIYVVKEGTFQQMKEETLKNNNAISNQYKTPRYLTDKERLQFLLHQASF